MKNYSSPTLTDYGSIADLTGYFGSATVDDVFLDPNGNPLPHDETGSINVCPTGDFETCQIDP